jgi:hypothetical protein
MSGCALVSLSKLSGSHQRKLVRSRILAQVDQSCAPVDNLRAQKHTPPATPSSIDHANCYIQRSAEKLLKQLK